MKKLKYISATKATQDKYEYWGQLFTAYSQDVLQKPQGQVPTSDDMLRFYAAIATLKSPTGKLPCIDEFQQGAKLVTRFLRYTYPAFVNSEHLRTRTTSMMRHLTDNRLLRYPEPHQPTYLTTPMILRMASTSLRESLLARGYDNPHLFNKMISRILGIIMVAACCARVGDIFRIHGQGKGECLQWRDIEIQFNQDATEASLENLEMEVNLRALKGGKGHKLVRFQSYSLRLLNTSQLQKLIRRSDFVAPLRII